MTPSPAKTDHRTESKRRYQARHDHSSPAQKVAAVLRLLKGEPVNVLSAELGVSVQRLERWHSDFLEAGASRMAKKNRLSRYDWFAEHSAAIVQWAGLLLALVAAIIAMAMFLRSMSQQ